MGSREYTHNFLYDIVLAKQNKLIIQKVVRILVMK